MEHQFNVEVAEMVGVEKAIIIHNIAFWIRKNQANGKHEHEGFTWTYNSGSAFEKLFKYWNDQKIRRMLRQMQDEGIIMIGNFNEKAYDQTNWYTIIDPSIVQIYTLHCSDMNSASFNFEQPIPDSKPVSNSDRYLTSILDNRPWIESQMMNFRIDEDQFKDYFTQFWVDKYDNHPFSEYRSEQESDMMRHFVSWLRDFQKKERQGQKPGSKFERMSSQIDRVKEMIDATGNS